MATKCKLTPALDPKPLSALNLTPWHPSHGGLCWTTAHCGKIRSLNLLQAGKVTREEDQASHYCKKTPTLHPMNVYHVRLASTLFLLCRADEIPAVYTLKDRAPSLPQGAPVVLCSSRCCIPHTQYPFRRDGRATEHLSIAGRAGRRARHSLDPVLLMAHQHTLLDNYERAPPFFFSFFFFPFFPVACSHRPGRARLIFGGSGPSPGRPS